jgi:hypothetical protein
MDECFPYADTFNAMSTEQTDHDHPHIRRLTGNVYGPSFAMGRIGLTPYLLVVLFTPVPGSDLQGDSHFFSYMVQDMKQVRVHLMSTFAAAGARKLRLFKIFCIH